MLKPLSITIVIALISSGYLTSQERSGLTEKQIRKIVREEIQKAAKARATRPVVVLPSAGIQAPGFSNPIPKGARFRTPQVTTFSDLGPSLASRTIAAAEKAVEAHKTLTKKQRVAALKSLDAARRAIASGRKAKQRSGKNARAGHEKKAPTPIRFRLVPSIGPKKDKAKPVKKYRWVAPKYETWTLPSFRGSRSDLYFDGEAAKTLRWETAPTNKTGKRRIIVVDPRSGQAIPLPKKHTLLPRTGEKGLHYLLTPPKADSSKKAKRPAKIHI